MNRSRACDRARRARHPHRTGAQVVARMAGDAGASTRAVGATRASVTRQPRGQAGRGGASAAWPVDALRAACSRAAGRRRTRSSRPSSARSRSRESARSGVVRHEPQRTDDPGPGGAGRSLAGIGLVAHAVRLVEARVDVQLRADAMRRVPRPSEPSRAPARRSTRRPINALPLMRRVAGRKRRAAVFGPATSASATSTTLPVRGELRARARVMPANACRRPTRRLLGSRVRPRARRLCLFSICGRRAMYIFVRTRSG